MGAAAAAPAGSLAAADLLAKTGPAVYPDSVGVSVPAHFGISTPKVDRL